MMRRHRVLKLAVSEKSIEVASQIPRRRSVFAKRDSQAMTRSGVISSVEDGMRFNTMKFASNYEASLKVFRASGKRIEYHVRGEPAKGYSPAAAQASPQKI